VFKKGEWARLCAAQGINSTACASQPALAAGRARFARCVSNAGGKPEPWTERPADAGNAQILHFNEKKIFRDII